jgi:hypothetical protein
MTETENAMTPEAAAALRAPFPPEQIGKLPKAGTTLDYVGHAAVTDRLLKVDPSWSWEPAAWAPDGTPMIVVGNREAVMWVRLTVCGVTRLGVGICPATAFELEKQLISDAIRNASMRFGVALDLWSKQDLHDVQHQARPSDPEPLAEGMVNTRAAKRELLEALTEAGSPDPKAAAGAAWKASKIAAGPVPRERLDLIIGEALDALFAELEAAAELGGEAPGIPEGYGNGPPT